MAKLFAGEILDGSKVNVSAEDLGSTRNPDRSHHRIVRPFARGGLDHRCSRRSFLILGYVDEVFCNS